jgi:hypothetical protein
MTFTTRNIFNSVINKRTPPKFKLRCNHACQQYINPSVDPVPLSLDLTIQVNNISIHLVTDPVPLNTKLTTFPALGLRAEFYDIAELSPLSTPGCSPRASPTAVAAASRSPSPRPRTPASPLPPGSPLLSPHPISPALKRARNFLISFFLFFFLLDWT